MYDTLRLGLLRSGGLTVAACDDVASVQPWGQVVCVVYGLLFDLVVEIFELGVSPAWSCELFDFVWNPF